MHSTETPEGINHDRRGFLGTAAMTMAAVGALGLPNAASATAANDPTAVRPFHVNIPEEALVDLKRRVKATRFPDRETVTDALQGRAARDASETRGLLQTGHDWRKVQARRNALPQFVTEIDGLDIHFIHVRFIHVRSKHDNALPMIVTHERRL